MFYIHLIIKMAKHKKRIIQKVIYIYNNYEDLESYNKDGWRCTQISACSSGSTSSKCYCLLEKEIDE